MELALAALLAAVARANHGTVGTAARVAVGSTVAACRAAADAEDTSDAEVPYTAVPVEQGVRTLEAMAGQR